MSLDSFQDSLFEDPIGNRFRNSREKLRWSKESVAQQLKLPLSIIDAIEAENWTRLGAPVYIRSYVGSYAKILGMPLDVVDEVLRSQPSAPPPPLVNNGSPGTRGGRSFDRGVLKLGSVVMTGVIVSGVVMLAMHFQSRSPAADIVPLDPPVTAGIATPEGTPSASNGLATPPEAITEAAQQANAAAQAPVMASLTPTLPSNAAGRANDLVLSFSGESWVDVVNTAGQHIERGLVPSGAQRRYAPGEIQRITVGNAGAVEAVQGGQTVDLSPFREANVARFAVSSEGKVVATGD